MDTKTKTGSWASPKSYELPADLLQDLRQTGESVEQLIERLLPSLPQPVQPLASTSAEAVPSNAFMDALLSQPDTLTTNAAPAFSTSKDPLVDLFYDLAPHVMGEQLQNLLDAAWRSDSLGTLKCIFQARSIHEGKGIKDHVFFSCMTWLFDEHPRTLLVNLHVLVEPLCQRSDLTVKGKDGVDELIERPAVPHGCCLLNLLVLGAHGMLAKPVSSEDVNMAFRNGISPNVVSPLLADSKKRKLNKAERDAVSQAIHNKAKKLPKRYQEYHSKPKAEKHGFRRDHLLQELQSNKKYRALYILVARLFASALQADLPIIEQLASTPDEQKYSVAARLSLCGKWAPTPGKSDDKQTLVATAISCILFPTDTDVIRARVSLQTKYLAPLRKALDIVEVNMAAGLWSEINYYRVPSRAMAIHKATFFRHDEKRFLQYVEDVAGGKRKISGATLFPHELLIDSLNVAKDVTRHVSSKSLSPEVRARLVTASSRVIDAQWNSLVSSLRESSSAALGSSIAVVDVSGSMGLLCSVLSKTHPEPIAVSVSLGILLAQLARPPFDKAFIIFSAKPTVQRISEGSLSEIAGAVVDSPWTGMNTDFEAVFDIILNIAVSNHIPAEDMVKKIFVFSDMQFDEAKATYDHSYDRNPVDWNKTIHQVAVDKYAKMGYQLPEIVYWNVRGEGGGTGVLPVQADQDGVEIMSGYSASLMKVFLGQAEKAEMEGVQQKQDEEEYDDLDEGLAGATPKKRENPAEKVQQVLANKAFSSLKVVD